MTREEAIKGLKLLVEVRKVYGDMQTVKDEIECLDMAIKALEQPTLDKIRAEIEEVIQEETVVDHSGGEYERVISKLDPDDVLQIIDKYKAESEG